MHIAIDVSEALDERTGSSAQNASCNSLNLTGVLEQIIEMIALFNGA